MTVGNVPADAHPAGGLVGSGGLDGSGVLDGGEVLLEVDGPLDATTIAGFEEQLDRAQAARPERVVVDLAGCSFVDARALTALLEGHRRARRYGGVLVLAGCAPRLLRLLLLTGLRGVFDLEPSPRT